MAFFKRIKQKVDGKWYPRSITVGKPVTTKQVGIRLSQRSTVSHADTVAVLALLGEVLGEYMAEGRTVKLDGVGTFYYTSNASGQGVDSPEKVTAASITDVRVRFIAETTRNSHQQVISRSMVDDNIYWIEWNGKGNEGGDEPIDPSDPEDPMV